jgi:hypothetical protein
MKITIKDGKVSIGTTAAELLTEVDAIAATVDDVYTSHIAVLIAISLPPLATPMTTGSFTTFYAAFLTQLGVAQVEIAQIRAKLALLKDP